MIEVKVKTTPDGETTSIDCHMSGDSATIALEMAYIVTKLPENLLEKNPLAFRLMSDKVKEIAERTRDEFVAKLRSVEQEEQDGELN